MNTLHFLVVLHNCAHQLPSWLPDLLSRNLNHNEQRRPVLCVRYILPTVGTLYHAKYQTITEHELQTECERVFCELRISKEEADYPSQATQHQTKSLVWFEHQRGHLTASCFQSFCCTNLARPSQTLISVVFQSSSLPNFTALHWGIEKEVARGGIHVWVSDMEKSTQLR